MIQIESVTIRELRGIRELEIELGRKNFVVSGPNGSGKSGVVDAVQFALTGEISRLTGKGTRGLSVNRHGPHVDRRDDPGSAEVSLSLYVPDLDRSAVLTRNVEDVRRFGLEPDDPEVRAVIEEVASHPEVTLSRREIIKYILVEAGQRSKQIQALLKLEGIGQTRGVLKTTSNKLSIVARQARSAAADSSEALCRHLDVPTLTQESVLGAINPHRRALGLAEIADLGSDTDLSGGILQGVRDAGLNRSAALRDVGALQEVGAGLPTLTPQEVASVLRDLAALDNDSALFEAITRHSFIEHGLEMLEGAKCPLCDTGWENEEALRQHLRAKLAKAEEADVLREQLTNNAAEIANEARRIAGLVDAVQPLGKQYGAAALGEELESWSSDLKDFAAGLTSVESIAEQRSRLEEGWSMAPPSFQDQLEILRQEIEDTPDQHASIAAQTFLTLAQDRFFAWQDAQHEKRRTEAAVEAGRVTYNTYCEVTDAYLRALYESVEEDFGSYYRQINAEDEGRFEAKLEPAEGTLDLEVAFYDQGMYPPGAYHSEGHQDAMGICLYLALIRQLLGDQFRLAVLDDVVMSVDRGHRKEFCRLLKTHFPDTQFIITTHDRVWAKQLQTEGLVGSKGGVAFHSWSVQTGPIVEQAIGIWDDIESAVAKGDTDVAAARLRRHMEYIAGELADMLGAKPRFRGDFSYDLGDLFPAVIARHGELLRLAAKAANKWKNEEAKESIEALKSARAEALAAHHSEEWVVNKAVHFNEWANFTAAELRDVVDAFKTLLAELRCSSCESWLYVTPRKGHPEGLRCRCASVMLNLG
ncbi:AAA family ATPase [Candidatus Palauibacter sp.]|uniref:AAA family ATPase n=1 Tax=Candidatus Palauibacter sp. TaxID=3101350 RepID=UPI003B01A9C2